jgi:squalene-hopene/tetraprenyl-beta-curcumene cyclase
MTTGAKVALIVGLLIVAVVGGVVLVVGGAGYWWLRSAEQEVEAREAARGAELADEMAAQAEAARGPETPAETAVAPAVSAEAESEISAAPLPERREKAIAQAVAYLLGAQAADGSWGDGNVGITALCTNALMEAGKTLQDPPVRKAVDLIVRNQQEDGGIYDVGLKTYTTSLAVMVLAKAGDAAHAPVLEKAKAFLIEHQWDEPESIDKDHPWYGGHGYGKHERPDLSNTQYFVEAMHQAGVPKDHPLWEKVVVFVSRTQDRSESNDGVFAGTDSGGMIYSPHDGGESKAGTVDLPGGRKGLKAYGSMTYAGFKSFIYADLKRDDPRVQAALEWIRRHWTFEENPELGQQGLYYYYQTVAKALDAWGEETIRDARRREHDWKAELTRAILSRRKPDGSWTNEADRWFEGYPPVPTSYALVALVHCR